MKIAIVASGTRGDVQPYVALGRGLRAAGHPVRVLTSDDFESLVTDRDWNSAPLAAASNPCCKILNGATRWKGRTF